MRKALIVGINNYPSSPLHGCINDASAFKSVIEVNGDGSPNFDTRLVTDVQTKSELKGLIIELFKGESDTALLYFSGHGHIDEVGGYLVTPDYSKYDVGVSMDEILNIANESKAKNRIIILDCCHSGAFGSPKIAGSATQIVEGVSILTASKDNEPSLEINGHGVFTNLLLNAMQGGASDLRGHITPGSIYAYIDQALGPWDQRPVFKTNITRFTSLRTVVPQVPIEILRSLVTYFPSAQQEFKLDPSFEVTNTTEIEHEVIEPFAKAENVLKFKDLQKLQSVGLVVPNGEDHMYFAAMNSKSCKLTALGYHYWRLVKDKRI
ncbi:peptidase C14 [Paenibacillus sp. BGI2013]|uniref:caspase family protein n=1 Tax=Paenibacillus TaxID=44249 RepID=UPI00096E235F|nr:MULTISPECIES: caspase family protein [Paenibacillus]OMF42635.1 peptidase C14 [Paenibacillus amylolyticus]PKQ89126.1 peptidase C14 [Paenibacillus sp. BGI2013]